MSESPPNIEPQAPTALRARRTAAAVIAQYIQDLSVYRPAVQAPTLAPGVCSAR